MAVYLLLCLVQVAMMLAEHLNISVAEACHRFGTAITERNAEEACLCTEVFWYSVRGRIGTGSDFILCQGEGLGFRLLLQS